MVDNRVTNRYAVWSNAADASTSIESLPSLPAVDSRRQDLPHGAARLLARAERWMGLGEYGFAARSLQDALALAAEHPELLRMQALAFHGLRRYPEAIDLLRRAQALRPDDVLIENNLGGALGESGDLAGAAAAFRRAAELAPELAPAWFNLGTAQHALGESAAAEASLTRALELEPNHLPARSLLDLLRPASSARE